MIRRSSFSHAPSTLLLAAFVLAAALIFASCGGGGSDDSSKSSKDGKGSSSGKSAKASKFPDPYAFGKDPSSEALKVGDAIIEQVDGRTMEEAYAKSKDDNDPFQFDSDPLQEAAGADRLAEITASSDLKDGELQLGGTGTPAGKLPEDDATPAVVPFAFRTNGDCHAGFVLGHPVLDTVRGIDLDGKPCSSTSVAGVLEAFYDTIDAAIGRDPEAAASRGPSRADVYYEVQYAVNIGYGAAQKFAVSNENFFARNPAEYAKLQQAVSKSWTSIPAKLTRGVEIVPVAKMPAKGAVLACTTGTSTQGELRVWVNRDGDSIRIAAVTPQLAYEYDYDPVRSTKVQEKGPSTCT